MHRLTYLLIAFLFTKNSLAQFQKKAEVSLVEAEIMLSKTRMYCDSILTRKGYYIAGNDSITKKHGMKTYIYRNKRDFLVKLTAKGDSLKIINWDEPISTIHLLFKEAELLDYKTSEINPGIFDNKFRMNVLIVVPQINRIRNTNTVFLAKKK